MDNYKDFCIQEYKSIFDKIYSSISRGKPDAKRRIAQKTAIRETSINAIEKYPEVEPSDIWKVVYMAHVYNVSNISNPDTINAVISADNSWKKSSGHAFEEMIKQLGNLSLEQYNIEIVLQKDLNALLHNNDISNEVRDISWLKEQIKSSVFDLFLTIKDGEDQYVYGCIQSKTSIRDRVTRDREPSMNAMAAYFMSIAIVLDGDFLRLPKFQAMVNGESSDYKINGWHRMYVFSNEKIDIGRIQNIDLTMEKFVQDAIAGAKFWQEQRQWFNHKWEP